MNITVHNRCSDFDSYRAARVKSLFNAVRACRMVVMPEWQGAGIGLRFLNAVCESEVTGGGKFGDRVKAVYFHTSHPGLAAGLRRDPRWSQISCKLHGDNKRKSIDSLARAAIKNGTAFSHIGDRGYGGHFRAIQGFKFTRPSP